MIECLDNQPVEPVEVVRVFEASGISRPTKDLPRIAQMFANANVVIGRKLIRRTQSIIGETVSLILMSAPGAMAYYPKFDFALAGNAYVIRRQR